MYFEKTLPSLGQFVRFTSDAGKLVREGDQGIVEKIVARHVPGSGLERIAFVVIRLDSGAVTEHRLTSEAFEVNETRNVWGKDFEKGKIRIGWSQSRGGLATFVSGRMEGELFDDEDAAREWLIRAGVDPSRITIS